MPLNLRLFLLLCIATVATHAQEAHSPSLNIGDPAPPLRVREWLKGAPVQQFKKGRVYVAEFWATWCRPCIAAMPHLSALAAKYRNRVTVLGIDVYERNTTPLEQVKVFVDSMGQRMDYQVAAGDSNFMVARWFNATGEKGIPKSFVVDAEGKLAWIGHPKDLAEVLPEIVNNTWDINEALLKRNLNTRLARLDDSINYELMRYSGDPYKPGDPGKPDAALSAIKEIVSNEPNLQYAPFIAYHTFSSLLKTNPGNAYKYGKEVLVTSTYEAPACYIIVGAVEWYSDKLTLPAAIYQLGAEACQVEIDQVPYPEIADIFKLYKKMAEWYWRAGDKSKAIEAQQKAIEALKSKKGGSAADLAAYESRLQQYRNK